MPPKRSVFILFSAGFLLLAAGFVRAQQTEVPQVDVDLVMVNATVTDPDNKLITDLKAGSFHSLSRTRVEQKIRYFSTEQQPLSLGLVFDVSHSMFPKIALGA